MNTDRLLALYDRVADTPDAVSRLRQFVLDLAVRGKLVEQNPTDEPASDLLKRITATKARLVRIGNIRKPKPSTPIDRTEVPFEVPIHWTWIRLGDIGTLAGGMTPSKNRPEYWDGTVTWLSPKDIRADAVSDSELKITEKALSDTRLKVFPVGSLFMVARSGILKRTFPVAINRVPATSNQDLKVLVPFLKGQERYLQIMFRGLTTFILKDLVKTGTTVQSLKYAEFEVQPIPLPPLAEQRCIVAKVDELMALCDRLEEARAAREDTRDRLTKASLARLSAPGTDVPAFRSHARFAIDALPALTARADQIKHLRQTILSLAVRGRLVEQDPEDEPASELLQRTEKPPLPARYAKRSPESIPGDCGLSINRPEIPSPPGWLWVPLVQVARIESGHTPSRSRADWWGGDVPWMGLVDARLHNDGRIFNTIQHTNEAGLANSAARLLPEGTVCFSRTASVGYVVIMGRPMATSQDFVNWVPTEALAPEWLQLVMMAERPAIPRFSKGAVHQTIYYPAWLAMHVALPPLAEQHRIVAEIDALMALCDHMEAGLAAADATRSRLLESLLHAALASAASRTLSMDTSSLRSASVRASDIRLLRC